MHFGKQLGSKYFFVIKLIKVQTLSILSFGIIIAEGTQNKAARIYDDQLGFNAQLCNYTFTIIVHVWMLGHECNVAKYLLITLLHATNNVNSKTYSILKKKQITIHSKLHLCKTEVINSY